MGSLVIDIADAVAAELQQAPAGTFAQPFSILRHYRPQHELSELKSVRVSVVPRSLRVSGLGRNLNQHEVGIDLAVQKKVNPTDLSELDGLMLLGERIGDYFRLRRLREQPQAQWIGCEPVAIYVPEHLETKQVFTSVLTLMFRVVR